MARISEISIFKIMAFNDFTLYTPSKAARCSLSTVLSVTPPEAFVNRKTKVVCTLGPKCWSVEGQVALLNAGMTVARMNFSHGEFESHQMCVDNLNTAMEITGKQCGLLLDTKGPEIRTGFFAAGGNVEITKGATVTLTTDYEFKGDATKLACSYSKLPQSVKPGNVILCADGSLSLEVVECRTTEVVCRAANTAVLGERKNMNLPGVKVDLPVCGEKEIRDIQEFGIKNKVDFVAASFVQSAQDVRDFRAALLDWAPNCHIIPKIENVEGLLKFDEILEAADGIMVARGDLGMEIPFEKVVLAQKMMIAKCNLAGKPIITATQMLESMVKAPRPTRAEATDVANAVFDGTDAVMLSGESANGLFFQESVEALTRCCYEAEFSLDYGTLFDTLHAFRGQTTPEENLCLAAVQTSLSVGAKVIVASGEMAGYLAKYRPQANIVAVCKDLPCLRHLLLRRGVHVVKAAPEESLDATALSYAKANQLIQAGDKLVSVRADGLVNVLSA